MPCEIKLFGGITVSSATGSLASFTVSECGLILAFLSFYPNRPFSPDYLAETFWPHRYSPDDPKYAPDKGLSSYRRAYSYLRSHLDKDLGLDPDEILLKEESSDVILNGDLVRTDVGEFTALVKAAALARDDELKIDRLGRAISLHKGELLRDVHQVWVIVKREPLENVYTGALRELVELTKARRQWERSAQICFEAIGLDPLHELPHRLLMEVYEAQGRLEEALSHFKQFDTLPRKGADRLPSNSLSRYANEIEKRLISGHTGRQDEPSTVKPKPTSEPSVVRDRSMPPNAEITRIERLPPRTNSFFGRHEEIGQLRKLLDTNRLVAIVGPAGVGKTRLSSELANELADRFSAVILVPLGNISDGNQILQEISNKIDHPSPPGLEPLQQVLMALSKYSTLLVLDNFEHLTETGTQTVLLLLNALPKMRCVITSRQELNMEVAVTFKVRALPTPDASDSREVLAHNESVCLFEARARAAWSGFVLTDQNAPYIAEICEKLDGLPLAIELAAARVVSLDLEQMRDQIKESLLKFLSSRPTDDTKDTDPRHRRLWAALNWSYRLLSPKEQLVFPRLSVFRGGWTYETAQAVCGADPKTIAHLAKCSMVVLDTDGQDGDRLARFSMLETLREFAEGLLTPKTKALLENHHADLCLKLAEEAQKGLHGRTQADCLNQLEADHANIRHALALKTTNDPEFALRLASKLPLFWDLRGYWRLGFFSLADLLERNKAADPALRAEVLAAYGNFAHRLGKYSVAEQAYEESISISRDRSLRRREGICLNNQGIVMKEQGRYVDAAQCLDASLKIKQELGDRLGEGLTLTNLGNLYYQQGDLSRARHYLERGLPILSKLGATHVLANALNNLGGVTRAEADYEVARRLLESALRIRFEIDDPNGQAYSFDELARLAQAELKPALAARLLAAAQALRTGRGFRLTPVEQQGHDEFVDRLTGGLGPEGFGREWALGIKMSADQARLVAQTELAT